MISHRAKTHFNEMLRRSMAEVLGSAGRAEVSLLPDLQLQGEGQVVMLTVASYSFNLMIFLYFEVDDVIRARVAALQGRDADSLTDRELRDALSERGNLCCGALNREIGRVFPHAGLSTPNILDRRCVEHVRLLNLAPGTHAQRRVAQQGALVFDAEMLQMGRLRPSPSTPPASSNCFEFQGVMNGPGSGGG